jgi:hypothetical protein
LDSSFVTDRLEATGYTPKYDLHDAVARTVVAEFAATATD